MLGYNAQEVRIRAFLAAPRSRVENFPQGIGFTSPFILTPADFNSYIRQTFPSASQAVLDYISTTLYPPPGPRTSTLYTTDLQRAALLISELAFTCNTVCLARAVDNRSFNYLFDVPPALHGSDLAYTFGSAQSAAGVVQSVRVALQQFVASFTLYGDPNGRGRPNNGGTRFQRYGSEAQVDRLQPATFEMVPDPAANERCQYLQQALYA